MSGSLLFVNVSMFLLVMPFSSAVIMREEGPAHEVEPLVVALADHDAERLLADDLGQQHEIAQPSGPG